MLRDLEKLVSAMVAAGIRYPEAQCEFERRFLEATLRASGGSIIRAAELSGLHRNTLARKIEQHDLSVKGSDDGAPPARRRATKR
jgi:DNA-binding NtrC family response regulator